MKHEDFDNNIDFLIIKGLVSECEQDDADFEAALKNIPDEYFDEIIGANVFEEHGFAFKPLMADASVAYDNSCSNNANVCSDYQSPLIFNDDINVDFNSERRSWWRKHQLGICGAIIALLLVVIAILTFCMLG